MADSQAMATPEAIYDEVIKAFPNCYAIMGDDNDRSLWPLGSRAKRQLSATGEPGTWTNSVNTVQGVISLVYAELWLLRKSILSLPAPQDFKRWKISQAAVSQLAPLLLEISRTFLETQASRQSTADFPPFIAYTENEPSVYSCSEDLIAVEMKLSGIYTGASGGKFPAISVAIDDRRIKAVGVSTARKDSPRELRGRAIFECRSRIYELTKLSCESKSKSAEESTNTAPRESDQSLVPEAFYLQTPSTEPNLLKAPSESTEVVSFGAGSVASGPQSVESTQGESSAELPYLWPQWSSADTLSLSSPGSAPTLWEDAQVPSYVAHASAPYPAIHTADVLSISAILEQQGYETRQGTGDQYGTNSRLGGDRP